MKKLKQNQLGPWCSYCNPKTTRATHRQDGFFGNFCCEHHKENLKSDEKAAYLRDNELSEADYQTWYNL